MSNKDAQHVLTALRSHLQLGNPSHVMHLHLIPVCLRFSPQTHYRRDHHTWDFQWTSRAHELPGVHAWVCSPSKKLRLHASHIYLSSVQNSEKHRPVGPDWWPKYMMLHRVISFFKIPGIISILSIAAV